MRFRKSQVQPGVEGVSTGWRSEKGMLRNVAKRLLALTPYRIVRGAENRFEAIGDCLRHLSKLAYRPRRIIDGGAHLGAFARTAHAVFGEAAIDMIEPQPACREALRALAAAHGFSFHACALGDHAGNIRFSVRSEANTGAHVTNDSDSPELAIEVEANTLDNLFGARLDAGDRALLKLDLQGNELTALSAGTETLARSEVVLTESPFLHPGGAPPITPLIGFLDRHGFDLFDVASLSGRARDGRLREGDFIFVRRGTPLAADRTWT